jgi:hypothetical protein
MHESANTPQLLLPGTESVTLTCIDHSWWGARVLFWSFKASATTQGLSVSVLCGPGQSSVRPLSDAGVNVEGQSGRPVNCQMGERCKYFQVPRFLGGLGVESLSVAPSVVTQLLQVYNRERRRCTLYPLYFIMSTNYGLTVTDTQVPNRVQLCGTSQHNVSPVDMGQRRMLIRR